MRVFVVTSFDYGVGHSRPLCAFASNAEAATYARDQDLQEDSIADEHRVTELVVIPEVGVEPIPTRDELRELRERLRKLDAAVRCHMAVNFECLPSSIPDAAVTSLIDELDRLDAASDNPRMATP